MDITTRERREVVGYFGRTMKGSPSVTKSLMRVTGGMNILHCIEDN